MAATRKKTCQKNHKSYAVIYRRLDKGMPLEDAVRYKKTKSHPKLFYKKKPLAIYCGGCNTLKYRRVVTTIYELDCSIAKAVKLVERDMELVQ